MLDHVEGDDQGEGAVRIGQGGGGTARGLAAGAGEAARGDLAGVEEIGAGERQARAQAGSDFEAAAGCGEQGPDQGPRVEGFRREQVGGVPERVVEAAIARERGVFFTSPARGRGRRAVRAG